MRSPRLLVPLLVVLLLAIGASSASGVIAHLGNGTSISYQAAPGKGSVGRARPFDAFFTNLDYSGGPVMQSNTNYTLYWRPKTAVAYPNGFQAGVDTYFEALEHDSTRHENVDSVASQYNNAAGEFVKYESKFGGELVDENPYPENGCTHATICLTDVQIRTELAKFVLEHKLPTDLNHEYFLLTPEGVESCFAVPNVGEACSANAEEFPKFCAYHSSIPLAGGGDIVYSNDPFVNGKNCDQSNHHINGPSDSALFGGLSHEHIESLTDPEPNNAWTDQGALTGEIGDKCRTFVESSEFGTPLGEVEVEGKKLTYNQEINGHKYWYQEEWSNKGATCLQRLQFTTSEAPAATFASAIVSGNELEFDATGSATGANVRYVWQFNDLAGHNQNETIETEGLTIKHLFPETGIYTVALTVLLSDGTSKGAAKQVFVGKKPQMSAFTSSPPVSATVGGPTYSVEGSATSGLALAFTIDASSISVCSVSSSSVSFIGAGTCTIDANQEGDGEYFPTPQVQQSFTVSRKSQSVAFISTAPGSTTIGGASYEVTAIATPSGLPVTLTIDASSGSVCSVSGSSVSFIGAGTCTIDANQEGDGEYFPTPQVQQSFTVSRKSQSMAFISTAPGSAIVGGSTYTVVVTASSGLSVSLSSGMASVCWVSGSTVSFIGAGTCTIDADQTGNANYAGAPQAQQSFTVSPASPLTRLTLPESIQTPNSNFNALGVTVNQRIGAITFTESVGDPGTFSWLITLQNGKFGAFAAKKTKCKRGQVRLNGKCRPAAIVFGQGSQTVAAPGTVTFTVKPSAAGLKALRTALRQKQGLPLTATLTFQSTRGGDPVSHVQSLNVRLKKSR